MTREDTIEKALRDLCITLVDHIYRWNNKEICAARDAALAALHLERRRAVQLAPPTK